MATSGDANNKKKYDVFLNHRGPDVKKNIASCLYHWLTFRCGLQVFLDSEELEEGQNLNTQIKEAIASASLHVAFFFSAICRVNMVFGGTTLNVCVGETHHSHFLQGRA